MKLSNPANGEVMREFEEDSAETIQSKFEKAQNAQIEWAQVDLSQRKTIIEKFRNLMAEELESLAQVQSQETGKPINQARGEVKATGPRIDFFLENVHEATQAKIISESGGKVTERISYEPLGVVANISAWNYPYFVGSNVFIPALLTGNSVLYKASEFCPGIGEALEKLFLKAGLPDGLFTNINGGGKAGAQLLEQNINGVFFTGSYPTGKKINESVADKLVKVQLELGGKDPTYVMDDADPKVAAESLADGAFYNCGQSCCAVERIYIHESVYDEFISHFLNTVRGFKVGEPSDEETYIGPLTREAQIQILESQIKEAVSSGAKLELGGSRIDRPGYYFEPTVLTGVNHNMSVMLEESFGPVIGLQRVSSDDEALELMNHTQYGLTAGVFGQDFERAQGILKRVNSGTVYFNCCDRVSPRLPWTGRGHSGLGSTLSMIGIETFLQPKAWHI